MKDRIISSGALHGVIAHSLDHLSTAKMNRSGRKRRQQFMVGHLTQELPAGSLPDLGREFVQLIPVFAANSIADGVVLVGVWRSRHSGTTL
jgi:hypothetical protein